MAKNSYLKSGELLLIFTGGCQFALRTKDARYPQVMKALEADDYEKVKTLMTATSLKVNDMVAEIKKTFENLEVEITPNSISIDGIELKGFLVSRIKDLMQRNLPTDHLVAFLKRAFLNPRRFVLEELFDWLDANDMPVTDDGCFLGYKRLNADFTDCYSGTFDNHPGQHLVFPMAKRVEIANRHEACGSHGFHVASFSYLGGFHDGKPVVVVKVDPQHVFSFPGSRTGGDAKLQCLEYTVLECINIEDLRIPAKNALGGQVKTVVEKEPAPTASFEAAKMVDTIESLNKRFSYTIKVGNSLLLFKLCKGEICASATRIVEAASAQHPGINGLLTLLKSDLAVGDLGNNLTNGVALKDDKYICLINDPKASKKWRLKTFKDGLTYNLFEVHL